MLSKFFAQKYLRDYKSFGFLIDDRPFITTIDKIYNRFITWQFLKLEEKGLLKQVEYYATYCEHCGPVAVDPSESDISKGGKKIKAGENNPYLRCGILLGNQKHYPLPGRLFRHGAYFDFMLSWKAFKPSEDEWKNFLKIIKREIKYSKQLEEILFNSRSKNHKRYTILHMPLYLK